MARKQGSRRSEFGKWIDKILNMINQQNRLNSGSNSIETYTQQKLANLANIAQDLMSQYCTLDPQGKGPKTIPHRLAVMKIIAVLGVDRAEALEALRLNGYNIDAVGSIEFFQCYNSIIDDPACKYVWPNNKSDVTKRINSLLLQAAEHDKGYRGDPLISSVFKRR